DAEVSVTEVRDARSDVIRLVECEAVEPGCHRGPENRSSGKQERQEKKKAELYLKHSQSMRLGWSALAIHHSFRKARAKCKPGQDRIVGKELRHSLASYIQYP